MEYGISRFIAPVTLTLIRWPSVYVLDPYPRRCTRRPKIRRSTCNYNFIIHIALRSRCDVAWRWRIIRRQRIYLLYTLAYTRTKCWSLNEPVPYVAAENVVSVFHAVLLERVNVLASRVYLVTVKVVYTEPFNARQCRFCQSAGTYSCFRIGSVQFPAVVALQ